MIKFHGIREPKGTKKGAHPKINGSKTANRAVLVDSEFFDRACGYLPWVLYTAALCDLIIFFAIISVRGSSRSLTQRTRNVCS